MKGIVSILEGELAEQIADALAEASIPLSATVTRSVLDPESPPWEPTYTTVAYACQGIVDSYSVLERAQSNVEVSDVKVLIVAQSLLNAPIPPPDEEPDEPTGLIEPAPGDGVTIGGKSYTVIAVSTDPARALWELQCRV